MSFVDLPAGLRAAAPGSALRVLVHRTGAPGNCAACTRGRDRDAHRGAGQAAAWMKVDACINADFWDTTWLHRRTCRIHIFHGVAGKYGLDAPLDLAPPCAPSTGCSSRTRIGCVGTPEPRSSRAARPCRSRRATRRWTAWWTARSTRGAIRRVARPGSAAAHGDLRAHLVAALVAEPRRRGADRRAGRRRLQRGRQAARPLARPRVARLGRRGLGGRVRRLAGHPVRRVTDSPDATPYLAAADALVTDHSSVGFEFMVARPADRR